MDLSLINKKIRCLEEEEETVKLSKEKGITCSMAVVEIVTKDSEKKLFVNVPTYLYKIMEVID